MPAPPHEPAQGRALASHGDLRATVRAPRAAHYNAGALGPTTSFVHVNLTNTGRARARLDAVHVEFSATRDGVTFPCGEHVEGSTQRREPRELSPGESFSFERHLDCSMPLPGRYHVQTFVRFEAPETGARGAPPAVARSVRAPRGDLAGSFDIVIDAGGREPIAYPARPGLYAILVGSHITQPLAPEAWARGDYHVVVALINGSPRVVPLGASKIAFLVYRRGSALACSGASERLDTPDSLGPGLTYVIQAPVTCAPSEEGDYLLVGQLTFDHGDPVEIGRVPLKVSRDPSLLPPQGGAVPSSPPPPLDSPSRGRVPLASW